MRDEFTAIVEQDGPWYVSYCAEAPGASSHGKWAKDKGAQYLAERGGAYWLLDEIAIIQPYDKRVAAEEFQVWKLSHWETQGTRGRLAETPSTTQPAASPYQRR